MTPLADMALRPTRAIVDLDALASNVQAFRRLAPEPVRLMAVVKANGYGHGAVIVARTALSAGASYLAIATVDEGVQLRQAKLQAPILVLGPIGPGEVALALDSDLTLAVASREMIDHVSEVARTNANSPARVHLKIDTGMRRYGCLPADAPHLARCIANDAWLHLDGIFTHFACADEADERATLSQAKAFDASLAEIGRAIDLESVVRHAANSAATLRSRRYDYDMVRLGIAMYGAAPSDDVPLAAGMRPVMSIASVVARVIELEAGDRVSYGGTYAARRREQAALIPIGYGDGYRRALSNAAWMGIHGKRAPVRGRVCMDQTVVGLPEGCATKVGDEVVVVGEPETSAPEWDQLAAMTGTIAYEMMTGVSARVPRVYLRQGEVVGVERLG